MLIWWKKVKLLFQNQSSHEIMSCRFLKPRQQQIVEIIIILLLIQIILIIIRGIQTGCAFSRPPPPPTRYSVINVCFDPIQVRVVA